MNLTWYNTLNKPTFTPPPEVFGVAWSIIYLLIFISFIILLNTKTYKNKTGAITLFVIQLILNFCWSPAFFYFNNIGLSFGIVIALLVTLIFTIIAFYKISKLSAIVLIPYLLWVIFATILNYNFMILNPWKIFF